VSTVSSSIETVTNKRNLQIYPNPSKGLFNLSNPFEGKSFVEIYDLTGILLTKSELNSEYATVDLNDYSNGMYLLKLISGFHTQKQLLIKN
jgi:hypothetical protein